MQVLGSIGIGVGALTGPLSSKDPFIQEFHSKVMETIQRSDKVPGLESEEFNVLRKGIEDRWNELVEKGVLEITTTDKEARPYFVALQAIVEHVLAYELGRSVKSLIGIIHTPMPATPLCTEGNISTNLVDPSIEEDRLRSFTVKARATIVRDYLVQGGDLYIVYPKNGKSQRKEDQQRIYEKELENYPLHLFDCPLNCESIDNELVGAFYLFQNSERKLFTFVIKMTQATHPQDLGSFGLWFSEYEKSSAQDRILKVLNNILPYSAVRIPLPI